MAVAIVADAQSGYKVAITVSGMVSPYVWNLYRVDNGVVTRVRGPGWLGNDVVIDHEAPLNLPVFYYVEWFDLVASVLTRHETYTVAPVTVVAAVPVIGLPLTGEYQEVTIQQWPEWERSERASVLQVPNSDYPIIVSDRMGAATSTVTLMTYTPAARIALRELLKIGLVYLLRPACSGVDDEGSLYLHVRQVNSARRSNHAADPVRRWTLAVTHTGMPTPQIAAIGNTLQDLHDAYPTTLQDIHDAFPGTLLDIAKADL